MFLKNKIKNIKFGYQCLLCNKYCVYLLIEKIDKIMTHFSDALCKKLFFLIACGAQLDNGV